MRGWVSLHRKIVENEFLNEPNRVYSRYEAFIDLLLRANHKDKEIWINNQKVMVKRGEQITSIKKLSKRWKWSNTKVRSFLQNSERENMLVYNSTSKYTHITLVNYDFYQSSEEEKHIKNTSKTHQKHTNNNVVNNDLIMGNKEPLGNTLLRANVFPIRKN